jgi:hypothetical protein
MADTSTAHYNFVKPEVGASATTWGAKLNSDLDMIDAQLFTSAGALNSNNLNLSNNPGTGVLGSLTFINSTVPPGQQKRWVLAEDASAEVGGSAGSNLSLTAYNDTGALLSTPMAINRASGAVTFGNATSFTGTATFAAMNVTGGTFGNLTATNITTTGILHSNSTLTVAGATTLSGGLNVTGATTLNSGLNVTGASAFSGGLTVASGGIGITGGLTMASGPATLITLNVSGQANFSGNIAVTGSGNFANINLPVAGSIFTPTGNILTTDASGSWGVTCGGSGSFILENNNALKPGGGPWGTLSDERIKTVTGEYEAGLDEVLQLRPVTYVYKGNDARTAKGESPNRHAAQSGQQFVGFVAQELEQIFPTMVSQHEGFIDGQEVTDLRGVDTTELIYALVNCVRQLKAEIEEMKAR